MRTHETSYCVLCEAEGIIVEAECEVMFNGDFIPVCRDHQETINNENLLDMLEDEQPN